LGGLNLSEGAKPPLVAPMYLIEIICNSARIKIRPPELLTVSNSAMVTWFYDFITRAPVLSVIVSPYGVLLTCKGYEATDFHNSPKVILR